MTVALSELHITKSGAQGVTSAKLGHSAKALTKPLSFLDVKKPSSATQAPTFRWVTDFSAFNALADDWTELFETAGMPTNVFQTFGWCWHWCQAYLPKHDGQIKGARLRILTAYRDGKLVLVWPMVHKKVGFLTQLDWLGDPVTQYGDVLVGGRDTSDKHNLLQEAWTETTNRRDVDIVNLRRVRADTELSTFLSKSAVLKTQTMTAPYMDLASADTFEEYTKRYSSRARRNRRRLQRRLEERGEITARTISPGAEAKAIARKAIELKRVWLQERGLASMAIADDRTIKFFENVASDGQYPTGCTINAVFCDDQPIAIEISFECKGRNALHVTVFDLEFEKVGVGAYLLERNLRKAFDDGLSAYDFLAPADRYKLEWCDDVVDVDDWAQGNSLLGKLWCQLYLGFVRKQLKSGWGALPIALRKNLKGVAKLSL